MSQHLIRVLAQGWWRASNSWLALTILDGCIHHLDGSALLVLHFHNHVSCQSVLMVERTLDVIDSRVWHTLAFEHIQPILRRSLCCNCLDLALELNAVGDPLCIHRELGVYLPFRTTNTVAQDPK